MAILVPGRLTDLSWSHAFGTCRVSMHKMAEERYPGAQITSVTDTDVTNDLFSSRVEHWVQQGYNLIVGSSFDYQDDLLAASLKYPNVSMIHVTGYLTGGANFAQVDAKMYQPQYLAGFVAGSMTKTDHICYIKSFDFALTKRWFNAYALGARRANPNAKFTVMHTNSWIAHTDKDIARGATNAMAQHDCDIISGSINEDDMYLESMDQGRLTTGFQTDWSPYIGEQVLISTKFNWEALLMPFVDEIIVNGSLASIDRHQWRGMDDLVCDVSQCSVRVPLSIRDEVEVLRQGFIHNNSKVFCGEIRDNEGTVRVPSGTCLDNNAGALQANAFEWHMEGTTNLGLYQLPERACNAGSFHTYDALTNTLNCFPCPAGNFARISQPGQCTPCNANFYSKEGAGSCTICPSGEFSNPGASSCSAPSKWWAYLVGVLCGLVALLLIVFLFAVCCFYSKRRYNLRLAPKRGRVIAVFTDVEKSTELTHSLGNNMKKAMSLHNKVITRNIRKFRGYSPKNLGDGYFIVFSSVTKAVQFCTQTQMDLVHQDWPQALLAHPLCQEECDESGDHVLFRGLRVRMGMDVGYPSQYIYNRLLSTYDYSGNVINKAARIEGAGYGGWVLMTTEVMEEAAPNLKSTVFHKENMMKLKGIAEPVRLWSAWEPPLQRRRVRGLESSEKAQVHLEEGDDTPNSSPNTPRKIFGHPDQLFDIVAPKDEPQVEKSGTPLSHTSESSLCSSPDEDEQIVDDSPKSPTLTISVAPAGLPSQPEGEAPQFAKYRLSKPSGMTVNTERSTLSTHPHIREMKGKSSSERVITFDDIGKDRRSDDDHKAGSAAEHGDDAQSMV
eukprot:CAMPEP_0117444824 /NCGR_PEP_ID=MMETSP0759-20121206/5457_1 /TAXON_ID=63605 /ORGANISM="Percolomonas cosmopolitus, Strain WS" /LENGTH=837 /DNA_ID=CAMNT_0005236937 /DNA_START=384 /DNA_END=2897 /DNA_ORIENTATION=-